jgi:hypothetical protein
MDPLSIAGAVIAAGSAIAGFLIKPKETPEYRSPILGFPDIPTYLVGGDKFEMVPIEREEAIGSDPYAVDLNAMYDGQDRRPGHIWAPEKTVEWENWFNSAIQAYLKDHPGTRLYSKDQDVVMRFGVPQNYAGIHYAVFQSYIPFKAGYYVKFDGNPKPYNISTELSNLIVELYGGHSVDLSKVSGFGDNISFLSYFLGRYGVSEIEISNLISIVEGHDLGNRGANSLTSEEKVLFARVLEKLAAGYSLNKEEREFYITHPLLFNGTRDELTDEEKEVIKEVEEKADKEKETQEKEQEKEKETYSKYMMYGLIGIVLLLILRK